MLCSRPKKKTEQDAQGEAQGGPIILEGGDRANVDGSRMLEQVSGVRSLSRLSPL